MRFTSARVFAFGGAVDGVRGAVRSWEARQGFLLRLVDASGSVGQGEASPLPGYSPDSPDAVRSALSGVKWENVPESEAGEHGAAYLGRLRSALGHLPPSARFAVETALLDLLGQRRKTPIWALLGAPGAPSPVPLSFMAGGADDASALHRATAAAERGIHTVKLKITGPHLGDQVVTLARVRSAIGACALRLDANRSLTPEGATTELAALRGLATELVEEPIPTEALAAQSAFPVPIALDESLQEPDAFERLLPHLSRLGCVAVVLKPMALGGFAACIALAERARASGLDVTVSHLFDGPVALTAAAHLALAVASRSRASGLDVHGGLGAWPAVSTPLIDATSVLAGTRPGLGLPPLEEPR